MAAVFGPAYKLTDFRRFFSLPAAGFRPLQLYRCINSSHARCKDLEAAVPSGLQMKFPRILIAIAAARNKLPPDRRAAGCGECTGSESSVRISAIAS